MIRNVSLHFNLLGLAGDQIVFPGPIHTAPDIVNARIANQKDRRVTHSIANRWNMLRAVCQNFMIAKSGVFVAFQLPPAEEFGGLIGCHESVDTIKKVRSLAVAKRNCLFIT